MAKSQWQIDQGEECTCKGSDEYCPCQNVKRADTALIDEFKKCLGTMSFARAGWDYQLSAEQAAKEARDEIDALSRARSIWAENSEMHADLRAAFKDARPLATISEIERAPTPTTES